MSDERSWRERHPFLYGISQTFGIFPVRRRIETVDESLDAVRNRLREAINEAQRREV